MPITKSNHLEPVPGDLKLWRYMSFAKFMNLLITDSLHFHVASGFDDDEEVEETLAAYQAAL